MIDISYDANNEMELKTLPTENNNIPLDIVTDKIQSDILLMELEEEVNPSGYIYFG